MTGNQTSNRNYKDSVFTKLFRDIPKLRELYNALEKDQIEETAEIKDVTLDGTLYNTQKNDIAFTVDNRFIILTEHQSSVNPNMPLRMLIYLARIWESLIDNSTIYKTKTVEIERPELYVLYNGTEELPDEMTLKLSDAFKEKKNKEIVVEANVKLININYNKHNRLLDKSKTLGEYSKFIQMTRDYEEALKNRDKAIKKAIKEYKELGILKEF